MKNAGVSVNARSIMNLMTLVANKGAKINITISGKDEQQVAKILTQLFKDGFSDAY